MKIELKISEVDTVVLALHELETNTKNKVAKKIRKKIITALVKELKLAKDELEILNSPLSEGG